MCNFGGMYFNNNNNSNNVVRITTRARYNVHYLHFAKHLCVIWQCKQMCLVALFESGCCWRSPNVQWQTVECSRTCHTECPVVQWQTAECSRTCHTECPVVRWQTAECSRTCHTECLVAKSLVLVISRSPQAAKRRVPAVAALLLAHTIPYTRGCQSIYRFIN